MRIRLTLTQDAQAHVNLAGLRLRLNQLLETCPHLDTLAAGDRIALAPEVPANDLFVLRRRFVFDPREPILEILLDYPAR